MDQAAARKILQELIKNDDLGNKKCVDCTNPNPQWASLSFAVFLCLQCAGVHRGFGVHVSFVRSVSMDTWQEEQIKRMQLGGNLAFRNFMNSYDAQSGGYKEGMNPYDTYHSWAATQYRQKLDADLAGKPWTPSAPPEGAGTSGGSSSPGRPSSAQGLRKSRTSARSNTAGRPARTESPAYSDSPQLSPNPSMSGSYDQKAANEAYFASLGSVNSTRPDNLPPSQGGRYQGFGNTPSPPPGSQHPAYGLSSRGAPTLAELQENPGAALSKGWSLLSAAVVGASRVVTETVIQPAAEKVLDPNFQAGVRGYVSEAGKRATDVGRTANMWGRQTFGVDVAESVGGVVGIVQERVGSTPQSRGYGTVGSGGHGEESSALYQDDDDDFFGEYNQGGSSTQHNHGGFSSAPAPSATTNKTTTSAPKEDDWDNWKDF